MLKLFKRKPKYTITYPTAAEVWAKHVLSRGVTDEAAWTNFQAERASFERRQEM